jgi:hypothetical protein
VVVPPPLRPVTFANVRPPVVVNVPANVGSAFAPPFVNDTTRMSPAAVAGAVNVNDVVVTPEPATPLT